MTTDQNNTASQTTTTPPALTPGQQNALAIRNGIGAGQQPMAIVPSNFGEAYQLANALATSKIIPSDLRDRAPDVLMMILSGAEMGLAPMASLRAFDVIKGVATLKTRTLVAAASQDPGVEYIRPVEYSSERAVWVGKRRGEPEIRVEFTRADAERAGLWNNGDNWRKYPADMLAARCSKRVASFVAPHIGLGIRTTEEMRDGGFEDVIDAEFVAVPTPPPPPIAPLTPTIVDGPPKNAKAAKTADKAPAEGKPASAERNKAAADEATAKAAESAKAAEAKRNAEAEEQRLKAQADADARAVEEARAKAAEPASAPAEATPAPADDDEFGGPSTTPATSATFPRGIVEGAAAQTFANFLADLADVKTSADLDKVKIYTPWSRIGAPGEAYGARMKEAYGKRKTEIAK